MRKSEFIEYVRSPEKLTCDKTVELQKLTRDFPWFQSAQMLLCRNLNVCENMGFEKQLRIAAAYSADRVRLHQLVMEVKPAVVTSTETKEEVQPSDENPESEKSSIEKKEESSQTSYNELVLIPATRREEGDSPEDQYLERQILSHAISNSNLLEQEGAETTEEDPVVDFTFTNTKEEEQTQEENIAESFDENADHSFTEWLKHLDDSSEEKVVGDKNDEQEAENYPIPTVGASEVQRQKASFYNPSKMAKLSVKEDDDLITETLAKIYAQQGNYEKAIKAYEKLSLKYPEKKVYFASQIKNLEENLNS